MIILLLRIKNVTMENIILSPISVDRLGQLIQDNVFAALSLANKPTAPVEDSEKFTIEGLAKYLGCTKATIHAYKKRRIFPYYQTGRTVFFKKSEVDKALASNKSK